MLDSGGEALRARGGSEDGTDGADGAEDADGEVVSNAELIKALRKANIERIMR